MVYLLLCIISSTLIFVSFKLIDVYKVRIFPAIVFNYLAASALGFILHKGTPAVQIISEANWLYIALLIGALFITMFYVIGITTQKVGITVTSVAGKMSVIIPVAFSIILYSEVLNISKITGITLALISIFLTVYKDAKQKNAQKYIMLPFIVFLGTGTIDSLVKFAQEKYITEDISLVFSASIFSISAVIGIVISIIRKNRLKDFFCLKTMILGSLLGFFNFGSLYFIIMAFDSNVFDSSIIFGLNNIGIVGLSVMVSLLFFKERLNRVNWLGISMAIIAIVFLTQSY